MFLVSGALAGTVIVATRDLAPGVEITDADITPVYLPDAFVPPGTFSAVGELVGRVPREVVLKHSLVRTERLADAGAVGGLEALVPPSLRLVRVELGRPTAARPLDMVDLVEVEAGAACIVEEAATVLAIEDAKGTVSTAPWAWMTVAAVHLVVRPEHAGFGTLPPSQAHLWLRSRSDARPAGLPLCDAAPVASVVAAGDPIGRTSPTGTARIRTLAQGRNAFVGELWLAAGAAVPVHRDATEEYLVVLEGHGTLMLDGVEHPVGPGTSIYMPANAEVSYVNGPEPFRALQVFAGPAPAAKYDAWR